MNTLEIYKNLKIVKIINEINVDIENVTIDTRKVEKGSCFIGIKGEKTDGNLLYKNAFEAGASLVILEYFDESPENINYLKENNKSVIIVPSTIEALGLLAKLKRSEFFSPVVAVTGSAGKTSTKDMIYSVLKEKYKIHKTIGNQNNHIGLPLTILSLDKDNEILVLEMGMNHLKEISYLTNIAKPDVAVITNVGTAHIGNLGSRENILKAKLEILEGLNPNGTVIINNDNDLLHKWYLENKDNYKIITIGINEVSDYMPVIIEKGEWGTTFSCKNTIYKVPVGGDHFIYNALSAIAVANLFNVSTKEIQDGIINFELSSNRMSVRVTEGITLIDDSYNANFDSMSYAIKYLTSLPGRRIAVLGSMKELGKFSESLHRKIGALVAKEKIDILITVGDEAKFINEEAINNGYNKDTSYHFETNKEAIAFINSIKRSEDNILVKASNSLNFKEIVDNIK
ncbi:uDP-N-acetylmuramoyl-tripeptide--D-alanyl-D-alanine ligase [Clostridium sp. CAG:609]|nr:uDP-N-acetylmuramoyl-tripeptide--D-alanyl-D-alanine ligase [Clostridium sp. CAG:609]